MKLLADYMEVLNYLRLPGGHVVLLPSDLDLATQRLKVDEYQASVARFESEPTPKEIVVLQEGLNDLEGRAFDRAVRRVDDWEDRRIAERRRLQVEQFREERALIRMEQFLSAEIEGEAFQEVYWFREYSLGERLDIEDDDDVSEMDPETNEVKINVTERNLRLLKAVMKAKLKEGVVTEKITKDPPKAFKTPDIWECFEPTDEPEDILKDRKTVILIDRMFARNQMAPELAPYFRTSGHDPGVRGPAGG